MSFIYAWIFVGCWLGGLGFWRSLAWPIEVGAMIARRAQREGL